MRILITNNTLAHRAGSELWVRDVAIRLLERGHSPVAYSRDLGEVAVELRREAVAVIDDLDRLGEPPEVIHGHHHLETMTAALRFPAVPVLAFCHGWLPPQEAPVSFPSIRRYLAVDDATRDRLVLECGLAPDRVEILPNFVDLRRFRSRPPLPERPRRALVLSNQAREDNFLAAIRAACREAGIEVDAFGLQLGRTLAAPEEAVGGYDLVFAKGRAALEAAAVGAVVIVCDEVGMGPMVTLDRLDWLRSRNFGIRTMREETTEENVARELARYDPADAARVSRRLRREADLERTIDRLLTLYSEVVAEQAGRQGPDATEVGRAASSYLRHGPLHGGDLWQHERVRQEVATARARDEAARLREELGAERLVTDRLREELGAERLVTQELREGLARAAADLDRLGLEVARAKEETAQAANENAAAHATAATERERAAALAAEVAWITGTRSWRLRQRLLGWRWLAGLYRRLLRARR